MHKGTTGYLKCTTGHVLRALQIVNCNLYSGRIQTHSSPKLLAQGYYWPLQAHSWLSTRVCVPSPHIRASGKALYQPGSHQEATNGTEWLSKGE